MSDSVEIFESILKKKCCKSSKTLYNKSKQQNRPVITPQDVISSVSLQLRAINVADSYKANRSTKKDLNKFKSSTYIPVSKLPTYEEKCKPATKFDTQCVTDTQLINVIEDAEIVDRYQGMTDAFETPFSQIHTEKQGQVHGEIDSNRHTVEKDMNTKVMEETMRDSNGENKNTRDLEGGGKDTNSIKQDTGQDLENVDQLNVIAEDFHNEDIDFRENDRITDSTNQSTDTAPCNAINDIVDTDNPDNLSNKGDNSAPFGITQDNEEVEQFSQILESKTLSNRLKTNKTPDYKTEDTAEDKLCTEIERHSQILNQCQEIEADDFTEIQPSPIFPNNNIKTKSKSPSPLVFSLDKFEHFESIAMSLMETNNLNKHVINSQLEDKELYIKMDEDIELNYRNEASPVLDLIRKEQRNLGSPIFQNSIEVIEIDKATSEEILNQLTNQKSQNNASNKMDNSEDMFKDEILFSSDEEDDYVHKELQDLPFTCALETSFYDQSDVLDKTMYVGFQTASNKSIQICSHSFVKAKSLLSDVTNDELTVTDLVKNCDNSLKDTSKVEQSKLNDNFKEKEPNPADQAAEESVIDQLKQSNKENTENITSTPKSQQKFTNDEISKENSDKKLMKNSNFMGFITANNKKIKLSEKALARCKKVFQDIDLSQNFDSVDEKEDLVERDKDCDKQKQISDDIVKKDKENINPIDDVLDDDVIMQEFENIEMSLENNKSTDKHNTSIEFKTASNKGISISEVALEKIKEVFKDVDFDEEMNENICLVDKSCDLDILPSQIISNPKVKGETKTSIGFRTASHKSIDISANASAKSKAVFEDINNSESMNKLDENIDKPTLKETDLHQPSITNPFVGLKTANDNTIKISKEALAKTKNIFEEIDTSEVGNKNGNLNELDNNNGATMSVLNIDQPTTSKGFVGFKTANNNDINISAKSWHKTKNIFNDIDSINLPRKINKEYQNAEPIKHQDEDKELQESKEDTIPNVKNINQKESLNTENIHHIEKQGKDPRHLEEFKSAGSKIIKATDKALAETRNIFKDVDLLESEFATELVAEPTTSKSETKIVVQPLTADIGFKTANKKNIKISNEALARTKNIFKDIDTTDFPLPDKKKKDYPSFENLADRHEKIHQTSKNSQDINDEKGVHIIDKIQEVPQFQGFKSASNKQLHVSKEALAKSKDIFKHIDSTDFDILNKKIKDYPTQEEHKTKVIPSLRKLASNVTNIEEADLVEKISEVPQFQGFKTASNKQVKITKEALAKSKNLFKDIETNTDYDNADENNKIKPIYPTELVDTDNEEDGPDSPVFKGFQTANKKPVPVSAKALEKSIKLLKNLQSSDSAGFTGFKTASNKQVKISEKALAKSRNIFKDIDNNDDINRNEQKQEKRLYPTEIYQDKETFEDADEHMILSGFQTGNNREVKVTEKALTETKMLFDGDGGNKCGFKGFETASKNPVSVSTEALEKSKKIFEDVQSSDKLGFCGFQTASNKKVKVSEKALAMSRNIFKGIDNDENIQTSSKHIKVKEKSLYPEEIYQQKEISEDVDEKMILSGFQTANDKIVKVSEKALTETRKLFDIDRPNNHCFKGFETASRKPVAVSVEALEKSKKILEDVQSSDKTGFCGFQTASNKKVKVSEKALAMSRNIFKGIDSDEKIQIDSKHNNVKEKEKSLYPEEIYQHKENFENVAEKKILCGFQTANDKIVKVSERVLTETRKLFDIDRPSDSFRGFETASNKKVVISDEALAKSKKLFHDIDTMPSKIQESVPKTTSNFKMAFQTGSSKPVTVSNEALARSKRLFAEIDDDKNITPNKKDKKLQRNVHENDEINAMIDTQVINNFEESLHTEDFHETPNKSKRSGSPILSCPRAKRRKKFETPYNIKTIPKPIEKPKETTKNESILTFRDDYKKNKKCTLKDLRNMTKDIQSKIDPYLLNFEYDNLLQFEFNHDRNDLSSGNMTIDFLKDKFLASVNAKLVPNGWLDNHLRLIIWKLISYEVKFKSIFCTTRNVIDQLKYRYDRELYNAQRPALRKIYEKDDVPSKTLVLSVVGIYVDGAKVSSVPTSPSNMELQLTDGWYCIRCIIDKMLTQLVCDHKIAVGSKIVSSGAELTGCEQGVSPWEDTSAIRLKIFGNSTRRARWDARLGYHGNGAILSQLSDVAALGGKVAKLRVLVTRVYPALYVERFEDGSTVTRSERLENLHQMKTEMERQTIMEKIYEEVQMEFDDKDSQDSEGLTESRSCMESGSQINKMMKRSKDPAEFRAQLTESQSRLLDAHNSRNRDRLLQDIQTRVRERMEKAGVCENRNVVSLWKIRVAGLVEKGGRVDICKGMMSIWKPNEAIREIVKEGAWIDVLNVVPTAVRYSEIQISAGRQSVFSTSKFKPPEKIQSYTKLLHRQCYPIRDLSQNPSMSTDYNEIDTVGLIFLIDPSIESFDSTKQSFQNVYLTDAEKNIICVNFWGGLKKFGFQNVLDTGQVVACVNLQKRAGNTRKTIPQFRVTELSYFTQTPKSDSARNMLLELNKKLATLDRRKYCEECVVLKNNYFIVKQNNENISPYRFMNNSEVNISKNKMFVDSPLVGNNKMDEIFNLTGLDFESTFKQDSELSEEVLKRKRKVNEKIARLKMYGEPPPLSPLHIINRSKQATNSYKSPLLSNNNNTSPIIRNNNQKGLNRNSNVRPDSDSSLNVANARNTPQKSGEIDSDVSNSPVLNRTYVKSVIPVKINFDVKDNNDSNIDHFAEEFDGSPPLSLD